ncbi:MAG: hypothetical protein ABSG42_06630 [Nitrospirota bacterium]
MLTASIAVPAHAQGRFTSLLDATDKDYQTIKTEMEDVRNGSSPGMDQRELKAAANRIMARRDAIAKMRKVGLKVLGRDQRGLFRLLIRNLDQINLSLLALITDGRGYSGYIKTGNQALIKGITAWQEGIRLALIDTRRCLAMARTATGPFIMDARLMPLNTRAD